jgi:hypothetical protein
MLCCCYIDQTRKAWLNCPTARPPSCRLENISCENGNDICLAAVCSLSRFHSRWLYVRFFHPIKTQPRARILRFQSITRLIIWFNFMFTSHYFWLFRIFNLFMDLWSLCYAMLMNICYLSIPWSKDLFYPFSFCTDCTAMFMADFLHHRVSTLM